ncbi:MAG: hypothetical protein RR817_01380 [Niameybacter sp.]
MESKIIEVSMQTGWEWFVQLFAIAFILFFVGGIIVLLVQAIRALTIYVKKNKQGHK